MNDATHQRSDTGNKFVRVACPTCGGPILQITNDCDEPIANPCGHPIPDEVVDGV